MGRVASRVDSVVHDSEEQSQADDGPAARAARDELLSWRVVADALSQGLCLFDASGRLVLFNRSLARIYGAAAGDLWAGMSFAAVAALTGEEVAEDGACLASQRLHLGDGRVIEISCACVPAGGWVAMHEDITARACAGQALREKAALLDATLASMREKSGLLQLAQDAAGAGLFDWHIVTGMAHLSPESLRLFGMPDGHGADVAPAEWTASIHPDDMAGIMQRAANAVETRATYQAEFRVQRPGQPDRWLQGIGRVMTNDAGDAVRIVGLNFDLTERKLAQEKQRADAAALQASEERLALAMEAASDGLWDLNVLTGEAWFSERWFTMLGYGPTEFEGRFETWRMLVNPEDQDRAAAALAAHLEGRQATYECEVRMLRKDGSWCWILTRGKVVSRDGAGRGARVVGTHIDIDARKAAEAQVAYMAGHDALTDLPNRRFFHECLDQKLADVRRHGKACAVLCLDLDRFKAVNDRLGHLAGDALLSTVAKRIRSLVRAEDTLARLGGDEFAILLDRIGKPEDVARLAERADRRRGGACHPRQQQAEVGLSIGIALAPDHCAQSDGLLNRADLALYRAKAEGRNTYRFSNPPWTTRPPSSDAWPMICAAH